MQAASIQSLPLPPPKFIPVSPRQENTASATRRRGWIGWRGKPCGAKCVTKFLLEETFIFSDAVTIGIFEEEREDDTCINKCALASSLSVALCAVHNSSPYFHVRHPLGPPLRRARRR